MRECDILIITSPSFYCPTAWLALGASERFQKKNNDENVTLPNFEAILFKSHKDKSFFESPEPACLHNFPVLGDCTQCTGSAWQFNDTN